MHSSSLFFIFERSSVVIVQWDPLCNLRWTRVLARSSKVHGDQVKSMLVWDVDRAPAIITEPLTAWPLIQAHKTMQWRVKLRREAAHCRSRQARPNQSILPCAGVRCAPRASCSSSTEGNVHRPRPKSCQPPGTVALIRPDSTSHFKPQR